jgi:hypothetical protein
MQQAIRSKPATRMPEMTMAATTHALNRGLLAPSSETTWYTPPEFIWGVGNGGTGYRGQGALSRWMGWRGKFARVLTYRQARSGLLACRWAQERDGDG